MAVQYWVCRTLHYKSTATIAAFDFIFPAHNCTKELTNEKINGRKTGKVDSILAYVG